MIKIIVKLEKVEGTLQPIIFLPGQPANSGRIACYSVYEGMHSEASVDYYQRCKPASNEVAQKAAKLYEALPGSDEPVAIVKRLTKQDRLSAWR